MICILTTFKVFSYRILRVPDRGLDSSEYDGTQTAVVLSSLIVIIAFLSVPNLINYSMVSSYKKLKDAANLIRGMDEIYKEKAEKGLPQGYDLTMLLCYCIVSLWRLIVTIVIYVIYCDVWDFTIGSHRMVEDFFWRQLLTILDVKDPVQP